MSWFELLTFRQIIPPDRAVTIGQLQVLFTRGTLLAPAHFSLRYYLYKVLSKSTSSDTAAPPSAYLPRHTLTPGESPALSDERRRLGGRRRGVAAAAAREDRGERADADEHELSLIHI